MNRYKELQFKGDFRSYQQRVLGNVDKYLADGKVNIVAAPGSGKTILGLELIRRLGEPCLILSPTKDSRDRWGRRLKEDFLEDASRFEELFSTDLCQVKLVNAITYQELSTELGFNSISKGKVNVRRVLRRYKIKTICLDEAHHLKEEWQQALEKLEEFLEADVKIISLTSIPPCDSESAEWKRYYDLCGEIDEEIFVPELVAQGTLCPHQDYVYFNNPTPKEAAALREYEEHVRSTVEEVGRLECVQSLVDRVTSGKNSWEYTYLSSNYPKEFEAILVLLQNYGMLMDEKQIKDLTGKRELPKPEAIHFQTALQFLVNHPDPFLTVEQSEKIIRVLRKNQAYSTKKVNLEISDSLRKSLISSVGKLESIGHIAEHEYQTMGEDLRMLVITDYIRNDKENLRKIGTGEDFRTINSFSIFETLRRREDTLNMGVLSGDLVILPQSIELQGTMMTKELLPGTRYCVVDMLGSTREAIELVSQLFRDGKLQILIGTKESLSEGWNESCVNSLILANFTGSYVSFNQMRGLAIRGDENNPNKTSNIWHLVTLKPWDFETVKHRFDSFMGPHYETGEIESGISRITLLQPPFDESGIDRINREMLERSEDRATVHKMWKENLGGKRFDVVVEAVIPPERTVPPFSYVNAHSFNVYFMIPVYICVVIPCVIKLIQITGMSQNKPVMVILFLVCLLLGILLIRSAYKITYKLLQHWTPARSLKTMGEALVKTLTECGFISPGAEVHVETDGFFKKKIGVRLRNATMHDQNTFNRAITEMLSPIENPQFLLVLDKSKYEYDHSVSFACPTVLGRKRKYAEMLAHHMEKSLGKMHVAKCRNEYLFVQECRRSSFVMNGVERNSVAGLPDSYRKYIISHEEDFHEPV